MRRLPLAIFALTGVAVAIAVMNLPDSFVNALETRYGLNAAQAGWIYRLLAAAAIGQAAYGAFFVLTPARAATAIEPAQNARPAMASFVRTAITMSALTLLYGVAALALTGHRGGFWLFVLLATAQTLWSYRALGEVAEALAHAPRPPPLSKAWAEPAPRYVPPLARGVQSPPATVAGASESPERMHE